MQDFFSPEALDEATLHFAARDLQYKLRHFDDLRSRAQTKRACDALADAQTSMRAAHAALKLAQNTLMILSEADDELEVI